jgi:hypothetical protein
VQKYITAFDDDGRGMEQAIAAEARGTTLAEHLISLRLGIPNPMVSVIIRYRYVPRSAAMRLAGRTVVAGLSSGRFHRAFQWNHQMPTAAPAATYPTQAPPICCWPSALAREISTMATM